MITLFLIFSSFYLFPQNCFKKLRLKNNIVYMEDDSIPFTGNCNGTIHFLDREHIYIEDFYTPLFKYKQFYVVGTYKKGVPNGIWEYYKINKDDTILFAKRKFKNGVLDGRFVFYHSNGRISAKGHYRKGSLHRLYIEKDINGNVTCKIRYKNGQYNGIYLEKDSSGKILTKAYFRDGELKKNRHHIIKIHWE